MNLYWTCPKCQHVEMLGGLESVNSEAMMKCLVRSCGWSGELRLTHHNVWYETWEPHNTVYMRYLPGKRKIRIRR
jgi:transcription elongation factor Elf1